VLVFRFSSFYLAALCPTIFHSPASVNETGGEALASSGRVKPNCDGVVTRQPPHASRNQAGTVSETVSENSEREMKG
jgi:hypothetical protein